VATSTGHHPRRESPARVPQSRLTRWSVRHTDEELGPDHRDDLVDRLDRRLGVGVRGQQQTLRRRDDLPRAHDPIALAEAAPQVARDRREDRRLIGDGDDRRPATG
jgi:hypothetical protein